jgi:hypothetical protein
MKRLEAPDHICTLQHVEVARHCMGSYGERAGKVRDVQQAAMDVGEHGPKHAQPSCGQTQSKGGKISLEEGGDIGIEPIAARARFSKIVDWREPAPEPAVSRPRGSRQFRGEEGSQLKLSYRSGQRLGSRSQQGRTCRPQQ